MNTYLEIYYKAVSKTNFVTFLFISRAHVCGCMLAGVHKWESEWVLTFPQVGLGIKQVVGFGSTSKYLYPLRCPASPYVIFKTKANGLRGSWTVHGIPLSRIPIPLVL